jgi:hypothetical protein
MVVNPTLIQSAILRHDEDCLLVDDEVNLKTMDLLKRSGCCCWQSQNLMILSTKKVEGSRPDNKIQSPRSPRSAPIDEG